MALDQEVKASIIAKYGRKDGDTGSAEVQIAILSEQIKILTEHLKVNIHDYHSKRGLFMKVGRRRKLLNYLKDNDVVSYREVIKKLNLSMRLYLRIGILKHNCGN